MTVFAIFGAADNNALDRLIKGKFSDTDRRQLAPGQWLVAFKETTTSGIYEYFAPPETHVYCIVAPLFAYYGWQDAAVWDWIEKHAKY